MADVITDKLEALQEEERQADGNLRGIVEQIQRLDAQRQELNNLVFGLRAKIEVLKELTTSEGNGKE